MREAVFYIILSVGAIFALTIIGMMAVLIFRLATGKMTREQLYTNAEAHRKATQARKLKRKNKKRKPKGGHIFIDYPSPLNSWGLWN